MAKRGTRSKSGSTMPDLDETVSKATTGDQNAFVKLWQFFYPRILKFLYSITGDAEDVCSEAWIKIAAAIKTFKGDGKAFVTWIYTIARNLAIDHLRTLGRRGPTEEVLDHHAVASDQYPSDVHSMLKCLKSEEAEIISLRVIAGLDVPSVASITGKSEANIRVITHRSLNKLNEQLRKDGWGESYQGGAI
jgi:RNA polymerase sigma-70 factor (ECF subfamily)